MSEILEVGADSGGLGAAVVEMEGLRVLATIATSAIQRAIATAESRRSRKPMSCCLIGLRGGTGWTWVGDICILVTDFEWRRNLFATTSYS